MFAFKNESETSGFAIIPIENKTVFAAVFNELIAFFGEKKPHNVKL